MKKVKLSKIVLSLCAMPVICSALVVGDFEGSTDIWSVSSAPNALDVSITSTDLAGVTLGASSLQVVDDNTDTEGFGYSFGFIQSNIGGDTAIRDALIAEGSTITMDITAAASDVPSGSFGIEFYVNASTGLTDPDPTSVYEVSTVQTVVANDGTSQLITFTLTDNQRDYVANAPSWLFIGFSSTSDDARTFYVDNIEINSAAIPEPATIGLIAGLGCFGIVALRRRRK